MRIDAHTATTQRSAAGRDGFEHAFDRDVLVVPARVRSALVFVRDGSEAVTPGVGRLERSGPELVGARERGDLALEHAATLGGVGESLVELGDGLPCGGDTRGDRAALLGVLGERLLTDEGLLVEFVERPMEAEFFGHRRPPREEGWWAMRDLNPRPSGCDPDALPAELIAHPRYPSRRMGPPGFEPGMQI